MRASSPRSSGRTRTTRTVGVLAALLVLLAGLLQTTVRPAAAAPAGDLVVNGSFEQPLVADGQFQTVPDGGVPGWHDLVCGTEVQHRLSIAPFDGDQVVELASSCNDTIEQTVAVQAGQSYVLSYAYSPRPGVASNGMRVSVDGTTVATLDRDGSALPTSPAPPAGAWQTYTDVVRATGPSMVLSFADTSTPEPPGSGLGAMLDAVSLVPVPVPYVDPAAVAQNTSWPNAAELPQGVATAGRNGGTGEARWYRFPVVPGSSVQVSVTGTTSDVDLTLFRDIGAAFTALRSPSDLARVSAESPGQTFAPSVYSPSVYSPSVYSPSVYSPSVYSPSVYSPSVYSPSVYSPSVYSPSVYSPSVYSPSVYSPSVYSPSVYSPDVSVPDPAFLQAFSGAQSRSLIGVSAQDGVADESISAATWNNTGSFYVRVQSRDTSAATPFTVRLTVTGGPCNGVTLATTPGSLPDVGNANPRTVVLTDTARLGLTGTAKTTFLDAVSRFTSRTGGVLVDGADADRTRQLNAQADANPRCYYAKNLVAQSLRDIVNRYRANGPATTYVVVLGGDAVVPFFRYADGAGLGSESDYVPPVRDDSASQASLRTNQVLGQDAYGAVTDLTVKGGVLPVPDLAVGRLVETPLEIQGQLERFLASPDGNLPRPTSSLVTGYDFLTGAADSVQADLRAGLGAGARTDTLITDQGVPTTTTTTGGVPKRSESWTANDLRATLLGPVHHDLVFLAGHFDSSSALAADDETSVTTSEIAARPGTFTGSLVFSAGCHSGYSLPDAEGIPGLTQPLDWAQVMAQQGATLIAGTGYQYADTDFLAYSAKLYALFAQQLRTGTAGTAVAVGQALVQAKQAYLAGTGSLAGIDVKSVLESTLYGLPMSGVDLPAGRTGGGGSTGGVAPAPVPAGTPGAVLGLETAGLPVAYVPQVNTRPVLDLNARPTGATYRWLTGPGGAVQTSPALPALPLITRDVTSNDRTVLRGVGFRSGSYADTRGTTPLTGSPGTEHNGIHSSFGSPTFFPNRLASPNWFGQLASTGDGRTQLLVTPAQHRAEASGLTVTERAYTDLGLQLYYSANTQTYSGNTPALAAPPSLSQVSGTAAGGVVSFSVRVTGDPSAGIQGAWITCTAESGPLYGRWASLDLTQSTTDSTLWTGTLPLTGGQDPGQVRFLAQAVNGVGLVGLDDDGGDGYRVLDPAAPPPSATTLTFGAGTPTSGRYASTVTVPVTLAGAPAGSRVTATVGTASGSATTAADGTAKISLPLRTLPGSYPLTVSYAGDAARAPSAASRAGFTVQKALTLMLPSVLSAKVPVTGDPSRTFTLTSGGVPLQDKAVLIEVFDTSLKRVTRVVRITDLRGQVDLGGLTLVKGKLGVVATFGLAGDGTSVDPVYLPTVSAMALQVG